MTISSKYPVAGTTVKVTVTLDEGYELDGLIITNSKGEWVEVAELGDGSAIRAQAATMLWRFCEGIAE